MDDLKLSKRAKEHLDGLNAKMSQLQTALENTKKELDTLSGRNSELEKIASLDQLLLDISNKAQNAFVGAIEKELTGYNSPLSKLVIAAIQKHEGDLQPIFDQALQNIVKDEEFKRKLTEALGHKLARIMVSKLEGEAEKTFNNWRADSEKRAKLTLGIAELIKSLQNGQSE